METVKGTTTVATDVMTTIATLTTTTMTAIMAIAVLGVMMVTTMIGTMTATAGAMQVTIEEMETAKARTMTIGVAKVNAATTIIKSSYP